MSRLHLLAHLNYSGPAFHPGNRKKKKNISRNNTFRFDSFNMRHSTRTFSLLTRSKTRENSGVLRVFKGSAGLRVNCSSVRGGTCLMKKYLKTEKLLKRPSNSALSQQKVVVIYNFINRNCLSRVI